MAYKKYIKRGGKIYGPYIYHSRRINGKVISEYRGPRKPNYKKIFLAIFGVVFLVALVFVLIFSERQITGKAVFNLDADYQQGTPLEGKLRLSLQEGELIPASSKLVFENNGNIFEYNLEDLISEEPSEGNFYLKGESISGSGKGYGIPGEKETPSVVYFVLSILSEEEQNTEQIAEPEIAETIQTENIEEPETENVESIETAEAEEPETEAQESTETTEAEEPETENIIEEQTSEAPITGNIISRFAGAISNFFLGFGMTGNVVIEFEKEASGQVSAREVFTYTLQEGERAEIKPRSVRTDSKQLSNADIELKIENEEVIVTTDYSEIEKGFGEAYLGSRTKDIVIDLSSLDLILEQGDLKISIIDSNHEIMSLETSLEEGEINVNEEVSEEPIPEISETGPVNETNYSTQETEIYIPELIISLTEQERAVLIDEFGNASVEVKATSRRGFINVRYELGDYWAEFNYDSDLSSQILKSFMDKDRIKWLKDIAKTLSEEFEPETELENFTGNYSI